jgi:hypothetical protein
MSAERLTVAAVLKGHDFNVGEKLSVAAVSKGHDFSPVAMLL